LIERSRLLGDGPSATVLPDTLTFGLPDCICLQEEFNRRERAYAHAYGVLTSVAETARAHEYSRHRGIAEEARIDSEVARLELEQHKQTHAV
jgi:hypothetical protein